MRCVFFALRAPAEAGAVGVAAGLSPASPLGVAAFFFRGVVFALRLRLEDLGELLVHVFGEVGLLEDEAAVGGFVGGGQGGDVFRALLEDSSRFQDSAGPLSLGEVAADAFEACLSFVYDGECSVVEEGLPAVLAAASRLQLDRL